MIGNHILSYLDNDNIILWLTFDAGYQGNWILIINGCNGIKNMIGCDVCGYNDKIWITNTVTIDIYWNWIFGLQLKIDGRSRTQMYLSTSYGDNRDT